MRAAEAVAARARDGRLAGTLEIEDRIGRKPVRA